MKQHALLVLAHPRGDSLTAQIAHRTRERLAAAGYTVDLLDLYAEDFDPRTGPEDEPDWTDREKQYSPEVRAHMDRIDAADTLVVVFPVWWFGLPAILKGWIDRVWNYGFAYGRSRPRLSAKRMLWLGLSSYSHEQFAQLGWDSLLDRQLRVGISEFCGIDDATVSLVHNSLSAGPQALTTADATLTDFLPPPPGTESPTR
ncbi:NAD(P)H oxidoreductase [Kitasatospora aureofaciens]|uniref:NAD(P)H oxidoreductase n=1 Tax=Kitasatospora aureofaciens TaxID=1894 RepID=UPI001C4698C1|nr:NAD(P)H oxidoreductase [Kitasatospora aureofaciens]MBV6701630.1 NAD(P)H oxidoreductase [Kitasatospora aureofaciens]